MDQYPRSVVVKFPEDSPLRQQQLDDLAERIAELRDTDDPDRLREILREIAATNPPPPQLQLDAFIYEQFLAPAPREEFVDLFNELNDALNDVSEENRPQDIYRFLRVGTPEGLDATAALDLAESFRAWTPVVETAYVESPPPGPPMMSSNIGLLDPFALAQHYLEDPNGGAVADPDAVMMYARRPWGFDNPGMGDGVRLVDIEWGWTTERYHEVLPCAGMDADGGCAQITFDTTQHREPGSLLHGNAVLGIVLGQHGVNRNKGIAPLANATLISSFQGTLPSGGPKHHPGLAIQRATAGSQPYDVILLEDQATWETKDASGAPTSFPRLPLEIQQGVLVTIQIASFLKRVVVEPAGNGFVGPDHPELTTLEQLAQRIEATENRRVLSRRDSGAIVVGSVLARRIRGAILPHPSSNRGCRVDCFAPGEWIYTAGQVRSGVNDDEYCDDFGETSGAGAIIAGIALALEGIGKALEDPIAPRDLRDRFRQGTDQLVVADDSCESRPFPPSVPNVQAIIAARRWG